jgi:hypothetical protein
MCISLSVFEIVILVHGYEQGKFLNRYNSFINCNDVKEIKILSQIF